MKNRYGVEYNFVHIADNLYRFDMEDIDSNLMRLGGKEGQEGINFNDLGMFDPSGGPYITVGSVLYWNEFKDSVEQPPLTVTRIFIQDDKIFVEVSNEKA